MNIIKKLSRDFTLLKAQHIFRSYNKVVDQFSKAALLLEEDGIHYARIYEGAIENFERFIVN